VVVKQNHHLEMLDGGQSEFKAQVIAGSTKSFVKDQVKLLNKILILKRNHQNLLFLQYLLEQHPVNEKSSEANFSSFSRIN